VALSISQVGEFSFILSKMGEEHGLMPIEIQQYFLCVAVATMMITPIFINYTESLMQFLTHSRMVPRPIRKRLAGIPLKSVAFNVDAHALKAHIVIVGYNLTARTLIHGAKSMGIPYVVIEYDPKIVSEEQKKGEPIIYGDATNEEVLHHARIEDCNLVVVTSSNVDEVESCLHAIKEGNPKAYVITRVSTEVEANRVKQHGADVAISDEMESNMEILITVLDYLDLPTREAYKFSAYIRDAAAEAVFEPAPSAKQKPLFKWLRTFH
jgi:CPA2 family monovalent cation:H+ antiporter-2